MPNFLAFVSLFLLGQFTVAQTIDLENPIYISDSSYLSIESPKWSPDGNNLVFSAFTDDKWSLFIYKIDEDTLIEFKHSNYNIRKPVWHSNGNSLVYDKIADNYHRLVLFNLQTLETKELLNREINSSSASFSENPDLVCFLGFDKVSETWQVYTYDFIYDNLNQLTTHKLSCNQPCFSPDGKHIIYEYISETHDTTLIMLNWYGNVELKLDTIKSHSPSWHRNSWRFYFIGKNKVGEKEVFSLRKNGDALIEITDNSLQEIDFAISPDGQNAVVIIEEENVQKLLIIKVQE